MSRQASPVCVDRDGHLTQPLLLAAAPSGEQADVEGQAAVQPEKRREEATAVWRATIPGTVACTLALFVQKMVRSVLCCAVLYCAALRCGKLQYISLHFHFREAHALLPLTHRRPHIDHHSSLLSPQVQQSYMDALPVFTQVMYSWRSSQKGLFLGLGGCCQQSAIAFLLFTSCILLVRRGVR